MESLRRALREVGNLSYINSFDYWGDVTHITYTVLTDYVAPTCNKPVPLDGENTKNASFESKKRTAQSVETID